MSTLFNISYDDVCRSSTLELSDMGKQAIVRNGCIDIVGSGDGPVKCPDDFALTDHIWPNNGNSTSFNKGKLNSKAKTIYGKHCADNRLRRIYCNQNAGYFYIIVSGVKMRVSGDFA